ncbi:MAG: hypothetical protein KME57_25325 [Scytonema hyalinum WJT4-NPBG1]|nr:hypothetical protein [Scytonema hyalinum WJT4-NPBG1]
MSNSDGFVGPVAQPHSLGLPQSSGALRKPFWKNTVAQNGRSRMSLALYHKIVKQERELHG